MERSFVSIFETKVQALIDGGAEFSFMAPCFYGKFLKNKGLQHTKGKDGKSASGHKIKCDFGVWVPVELDRYVVEIQFRVLKVDYPLLLFGDNVLQYCNVLGNQKVLQVPVQSN